MSSSSNYSLVSSETALPAGCCYGIELTAETSMYPVPGRPQAWRLRVTVTRWSNIDPNIFMFRAHTNDPESGEPYASFECVASPVDLEEYPVGEPLSGENAHPYFRLAEVDLLFRNEELLNETWEAIKQDRDELVRTITQICELHVAGVDAGGCFEPESSSSELPYSSSDLPTASSSSSLDCPDPGGCLTISESDDLNFPAGTQLLEIIDMNQPDWPCVRSFYAEGVDASRGLYVSLSKISHQAILTATNGDESVTDTAGMSDEYKMVLHYQFASGEEHTVWIGGLVPCQSSSSSS